MSDPRIDSTPRVLVEVVDDNPDLRVLLARALDVLGYDARTHESARAFLDSPPLDRPYLMVVDIRMPGMSGLELHRHLRSLGNEVPVILISGDSDLSTAGESLACERARFMWKPFTSKELRESLVWAEQLMSGQPGT